MNSLGTQTYAGFWLRFCAFLIDQAIWCLGFFILLLASNTPIHGPVEPSFALNPVMSGGSILFIIGPWLYFALLESSSWQATLGKRLLSIKVTDLDGKRISFGRATGRYFAKFLSSFIFCIGYIMIAFTKRKQGLHDIIAETLVVRD